MLETIREYALERLEASGEAEQIRRRHAVDLVALSERAQEELWLATGPRWLDRLQLEQDNVRAALGWAIECGEAEIAVRLAGAFKSFWHLRGAWAEGRAWLERVLPLCEAIADPGWRVRVWDGVGMMAWLVRDYERATSAVEQALVYLREEGDPEQIGYGLNKFASLLAEQGDATRASMLREESLRLHRQIGNQSGIADTLYGMAWDLWQQGDARAEACLLESLAFSREVAFLPIMAGILALLARCVRARGDAVQAQAYAQESLALARELDIPDGIAAALLALAALACDAGAVELAAAHVREALTLAFDLKDRWLIADGLDAVVALVTDRRWKGFDPVWAARLAGATEQIRAGLPPRALADQRGYEQAIAAARAHLDEAAFAAARAAGRALSLEQAVACALTETADPV